MAAGALPHTCVWSSMTKHDIGPVLIRENYFEIFLYATVIGGAITMRICNPKLVITSIMHADGHIYGGIYMYIYGGRGWPGGPSRARPVPTVVTHTLDRDRDGLSCTCGSGVAPCTCSLTAASWEQYSWPPAVATSASLTAGLAATLPW